MQTTGSSSESDFSYKASTSSMRAMYSWSSAATHHIFFPPRLQIMIPEQNADRFPPHLPHQLLLHRFLGDESNAPPRLPSGGWLHTMAMILWLGPASRTRGWPGCGFSYNAGSRPSSS
jgi:hypothetical protein